MLFLPLLTIINAVAPIFTDGISSEIKKNRSKRDLFDTVQSSDDHDWSKKINSGTGINPFQSFSDINKIIKHLEEVKEVNQTLVNIEIAKLNSLERKLVSDVDNIQKKWNLYDEAFEDILKWGIDIEKGWKYGSIKWRVDSKDGYEIMNGNKNNPLNIQIEKTSQYDDNFKISTRSFIKIGNKAFLIKFPAYEWKGMHHYVPLIALEWSEQIGSKGFWKDYMGPRIKFAKAITVAGKNGKLINVMDDNHPILGIGLYYDNDRDDMREKVKKLLAVDVDLSKSVCDYSKNIDLLSEEIVKINDAFQNHSKYNDLELALRNANWWNSHATHFNKLIDLKYSFVCKK